MANDENIDFSPVGKAFADKVAGKGKKVNKQKQKRPINKTKLEKLDEVDEREDMSSDEESQVDIDKLLLGDRANKKKLGPTESFMNVQGELKHLQSLKLVENLLDRQNSMLSDSKEDDPQKMFDTLTKMNA